MGVISRVASAFEKWGTDLEKAAHHASKLSKPAMLREAAHYLECANRLMREVKSEPSGGKPPKIKPGRPRKDRTTPKVQTLPGLTAWLVIVSQLKGTSDARVARMMRRLESFLSKDIPIPSSRIPPIDLWLRQRLPKELATLVPNENNVIVALPRDKAPPGTTVLLTKIYEELLRPHPFPKV